MRSLRSTVGGSGRLGDIRDGRTREVPADVAKGSAPLMTLLPRHYHARIVKHFLRLRALPRWLTASPCPYSLDLTAAPPASNGQVQAARPE
jgi:hypothetical protein